jgi:hypothetical protein
MLHRKNTTNLELSKTRLKHNLQRRVLIEASKDVDYRNWSAPRARTFFLALRRLDPILEMSLDELEMAYPKMQRQWFSRHDDRA